MNAAGTGPTEAVFGIEATYIDQAGQRREAPIEIVHAIGSIFAPAAGEARGAMVPPVLVVAADLRGAALPLALAPGDRDAAIGWTVTEEGGRVHAGSGVAGDRDAPAIALPPLPMGYHVAMVDAGAAARAETMIVAAPAQAYLPPAVDQGPGVWGIAVQVYALRRAGDWGMGDFTSLAAFVRDAAAAGASVVGINPLHTLHLADPHRSSPYSPSHRSYLNPLYIDVAAVADFVECEAAQHLVATTDFSETLHRLREAALIDYPAVARCKLAALDLSYRHFRRAHLAAGTERAAAFRHFLDGEGDALRDFAVFQAIQQARGAVDPAQRDWRRWPQELRDPHATAVRAFADDHAERVEFYLYLEWIARGQLAACAAAARDGGMAVGLYRDLAVGVDAAAGEAWLRQDVIVGGWSVGAPPDIWARNGQDWGLSPLNPAALRTQRYRPFIEMIRANMRDAGALRIDHVLGLWRTFWIRHGDPPARGAYVRYPFADLVAILALESRRSGCIVIGEDLGTVPAGLREALEHAGILSYRLLYFERRPDGSACRPSDYPRHALVAIGTHDLPTLKAFWSGGDVGLRADLGILAEPAHVAAERARRQTDIGAIVDALNESRLRVDAQGDVVPTEAAYRFLARTPGRIVMVQIEDALGLEDQVNVPGTIDTHPNWRRRLPLPVEAIFTEPAVRSLCAALREERPLSRATPS